MPFLLFILLSLLEAYQIDHYRHCYSIIRNNLPDASHGQLHKIAQKTCFEDDWAERAQHIRPKNNVFATIRDWFTYVVQGQVQRIFFLQVIECKDWIVTELGIKCWQSDVPLSEIQ